AIVAQDLTALGFVALGAAIAYRWYRDPVPAQGMLALALITLGAVAALGRIPNPPGVLSVVNVALFILSGFFVLLFRNEFVPLGRPAAIVLTQLVALAAVPVIYVSFAPPSLLRRIWRMGEENEVRAAMQDLLIFTPSRQDLAERAAYWAVRLMGATAGFVSDA